MSGNSDDNGERAGGGSQETGGHEQKTYTQASATSGQPTDEAKKPNILDKVSGKVKAELPILILMVKGALAPTIAIAIYQSHDVATEYTTLGYLMAIMSLLGFAIMPRAKFIQTMTLDLLAVCIGSAVGLLGLWSAIQARHHTTAPGQPLTGYNSSASAVCAVWLFFNILVVNAMRSAYPQFNFPTIIYSIFAIVAFVYGPLFPNNAAMTSFVRRLIIAFLSGFGLATGVSFIFFPSNARHPVFMELTGLLGTIRGNMKAQIAYMDGFSSVNPYDAHVPKPLPKKSWFAKFSKAKNHPEAEPKTPHFLQDETAALKASLNGMVTLFGKLYGDLPFAKREFCFGKLSADDIQELYSCLREVAHPLLGLGGIVEIFERVSRLQGWDSLFSDDHQDTIKVEEDMDSSRSQESFDEWRQIMRTLSSPFGRMTEVMCEAIDHVLYRMELQKPSKKQADTEAKTEGSSPGQDGFAEYLEAKIEQLDKSKHDTLKTFCKDQGIAFPAAPDSKAEDWVKNEQDIGVVASKDERRRRELFLVLYMEHLLFSAAQALLAAVKFADSKVADGTMKKRRFISPGFKRLHKWGVSIFSQGGASQDSPDTIGEPASTRQIFFGEAWNSTSKDPEHLPAQGFLEHLGNAIRLIPRLMRSEHVAFGFRAACSTLSIALIAYLRPTQQFFIKQRLLWGLIMAAFSMMRTTGHSVFNFLARIMGTTIAMVASFVVWYIVDGKTPGVIVFLFIWMTICFYPVLKKPELIIVAILSCVTVLLIVGYELQVDKIGIAQSESNGQPAYKIYLLAPYRLAVVAGGLFVAYFWTIFPYPITEQHELRRRTGATLYASASYYSLVHEVFLTRLQCSPGYLGSKALKGTPAARLEKAQTKMFSKAQLLILALKDAAAFTVWDFGIGGRFPRERYVALTAKVERIINCTKLISYASRSFLEHESLSEDSKVWQNDFRRLMKTVSPTSKEITSRLVILSSSLSTGQPLPPYIRKLEPFQLVSRLSKIDSEALSLKHLEQPGYSAFAVCQIAARAVVADLNDATEIVRELVGELDFSFNVIEADERGSEGTSSDERSPPSSSDGKAIKGD